MLANDKLPLSPAMEREEAGEGAMASSSVSVSVSVSVIQWRFEEFGVPLYEDLR